MKILIPIFLFFLSISRVSGQNNILELSASPSGNSDISVHLKSSCNFMMVYNGYSYTVENQTVTISVCYRWGFSDVYTELQNDIIIPEINTLPQNLTLIVKIYGGFSELCTYETVLDTGSLNFSTPLTETVYLSTDPIKNGINKITLFPNPTKGILKYEIFGNFQPMKITILDNLGREVDNFKLSHNNTLNLEKLQNGVYNVLIYSNLEIIKKKIILNR